VPQTVPLSFVITSEARDLLSPQTLQTPIPDATNNLMNKAIVTYASLDEMKDAELREWRALPARTNACAQLPR
jgi:hypothetical protein